MSKVILLDGGIIGTYVKQTDKGHIIRTTNDIWPFPDEELYNSNEFKYIGSYDIIKNTLEEAPF